MPDSGRPRFCAQVMEGSIGCSTLFVIPVASDRFPWLAGKTTQRPHLQSGRNGSDHLFTPAAEREGATG